MLAYAYVLFNLKKIRSLHSHTHCHIHINPTHRHRPIFRGNQWESHHTISFVSPSNIHQISVVLSVWSTWNVAKAMFCFRKVKRSHVSIWKWIQKFRHRRISSTRRNKISEYIVDETILQVGPKYIWLWVSIEPENGQILAQDITQKRNMLIAERFLSGVVR